MTEPASDTTERHLTPRGELALRRRAAHFEVISNGVFLMDTRDGRSERLLAQATLAAAVHPKRVLVGGLGVGFTAAAALADPTVDEVVVVEVEAAIIAWQRDHFAGHAGDVQGDRRCRVVHADLLTWLATTTGRFDAICLDIDNGPGWVVTDHNAGLYGDAGLDRLAARTVSDGALGVWCAARDARLEQGLRPRFTSVQTHEVPVSRGAPDVIAVAASPVDHRRRDRGHGAGMAG